MTTSPVLFAGPPSEYPQDNRQAWLCQLSIGITNHSLTADELAQHDAYLLYNGWTASVGNFAAYANPPLT